MPRDVHERHGRRPTSKRAWIEPQQADTIGSITAQFGAILRILRSGVVKVRAGGGAVQKSLPRNRRSGIMRA